MQKLLRHFVHWVVIPFCAFNMASADEVRTWTSKAGTSAEGKFVSNSGGKVVLELKDGRKISLRIDQLSDKDRTFLEEMEKASSSSGAGQAEPVVGTPAKDAKVDTSLFVKRDEDLIFEDTELKFDVLETPHFLFLYEGSRPRVLATLSEKLWQGMSVQHPSFAETWGERRLAVFLLEEAETYQQLGVWHADHLTEEDHKDFEVKASEAKSTIKVSAGASVHLSDAFVEKEKLLPFGRLANLDRADPDDTWSAFYTHLFSSDLLMGMAGGDYLQLDKENGYFFLEVGQCYLKEIRIAKEVRTILVSAENSVGGDETIFTGEEFADGDQWAPLLRKSVSKEEVTPSLSVLYSLDQPSLTQAKAALCFSLVDFFQSTPERLLKFGELMKKTREDGKVPEPEAIAEIYGEESVESFETKWKEHILDRSAFR